MSEQSQTTYHSLNNQLTLRQPSGETLIVKALEIAVDTINGSPTACILTFEVSFEVYQHIDSQALFHLKPEVREKIFEEFKPDKNIEIEIKLADELLPNLIQEAVTATEVANNLLKINNTMPSSPLLITESWYGLYVKQEISLPPEFGSGSLKTGYSTSWSKSEK